MMHRSAAGATLLEGSSAVLTGLGVLTLALFPLAIPLIALTAVALIPLLALALAVGACVALAAAPLLLFRWLRDRGRARPSRERSESGRRPPSRIRAHEVVAESR
jgi:membrane protein implicated in regulation of membrane protease activity